MKKLVSLILVLVLSLSCVAAIAEDFRGPSSVTNEITVLSEGITVNEPDETAVEEAAAELAELNNEGAIKFFGDFKDMTSEGTTVDLNSIGIDEYGPIDMQVTGGAVDGKKDVTFGVRTDYNEGETVFVFLFAPDSEGNLVWHVYEGIADGNGGVSVPGVSVDVLNGATRIAAGSFPEE